MSYVVSLWYFSIHSTIWEQLWEQILKSKHQPILILVNWQNSHICRPKREREIYFTYLDSFCSSSVGARPPWRERDRQSSKFKVQSFSLSKNSYIHSITHIINSKVYINILWTYLLHKVYWKWLKDNSKKLYRLRSLISLADLDTPREPKKITKKTFHTR